MTMDPVRRIIGPASRVSIGLQRWSADTPIPKLCLCEPRCSDLGDRALALLTHEMDFSVCAVITNPMGRSI
jgi:hypothetical protein